MMIEQKIKAVVRDVIDFPKPGIVFKDITPILMDPILCTEIINAMEAQLAATEIDVIAGVESRGFIFGAALAQRLKVPFVPIRKAGKLPYKTIQQTYDLEYGTATLEMHLDAVKARQKVLVHDDLLATGGTLEAASRLIRQVDGEIAGYSFIIGLDFLKGKDKLTPYSEYIYSLASYT